MGEKGVQGQEEDIVKRWQSDRFPERTGEQEEGEESIESRVARIKARVAELLGNVETPTMTTKEDKEAKAMWNVLGYTITETGNEELDKEILAIHKQRMEDILGEQIGGKAGYQEQGNVRSRQEKRSPDLTDRKMFMARRPACSWLGARER